MQIAPKQLGSLVEYISKENRATGEWKGPHPFLRPIKLFHLSDTICPLTTKSIAELFAEHQKSFPGKNYLIAMSKESDTEVLYDGTAAVSRYFSSDEKVLTTGDLQFFIHIPKWDYKDSEILNPTFQLILTIPPGSIDLEESIRKELYLRSFNPILTTTEKSFLQRVTRLSPISFTEEDELNKKKCAEEAKAIKSKYQGKEIPPSLADALKKYDDFRSMTTDDACREIFTALSMQQLEEKEKAKEKAKDPAENGFPYRVQLLSFLTSMSDLKEEINSCKKEAEGIKEKYKDTEIPKHLDEALQKLDKLSNISAGKVKMDCTIL